ncbi:MAG TPA: response regulator transcription factor, partial [Terriglobales bacterium]
DQQRPIMFQHNWSRSAAIERDFARLWLGWNKDARRGSFVTMQVLIVDDSPQWRVLVRSLLERIPSLRIVGEASNGLEAIKKTTTLLPDIVLLDIEMPLLNGIEAAKRIRQAHPESRVIFLTQEDDCDVRSEGMANGASAYVLKSTAANELQHAIETAMLQTACED